MIVICVMSMVTMCFHVHSKVFLSNHQKAWFVVTFIGIAVGAAVEFLRAWLEAEQMLPVLYKCITLAEFCITPMLPVPLSLACGIKKPVYFVGGILLLHAAIELILVCTGAVFYLDADGNYHRGEYYIIYITAYVVSLLYLLMTFYLLSRRFRNRNPVTLIAAGVVIFTGIIPSLIHRETRTAYVGMTFMAVILYCYYDGLAQQDIADDLAAQNTRIKNMQTGTIMGIANLIEGRDSNTGAHVKNTSDYVSMLAHAALDAGIYPETIDAHFVELVKQAAPLHDIGKIAVPDRVLLKPGKLTDEEFELMKKHAVEGGRMIYEILDETADKEYTTIAFEVTAYHHEKWNGKGYPFGLAGNDIPVSARIMAIADVYDALTMERVYKKAFSVEKALAIIEEDTGTHFDPVLAPLFVELIRKNTQIRM